MPFGALHADARQEFLFALQCAAGSVPRAPRSGNAAGRRWWDAMRDESGDA